MDKDKDERSQNIENKSSLGLNTGPGAPDDGLGSSAKLELNHPLLPSVPVIADAGTTRNIEASAPLGQVLPFESQVQGHIGRQLRALYDHVLDQPIPDRFLTLLQQLDAGDPEAQPDPGAGPDEPSATKGDA
jgi:hypothetical protein